jgi:eukaryotic-like serine/threonine-protein kinase
VTGGRLPAGHVMGGRFQVAALLGAGDVGEVYDVRDTGSGYAYIVKLLTIPSAVQPETWAAYQDQARQAAALATTVFAKGYDWGTDAGTNLPYELREYVTVSTVASQVQASGPMAEAQVTAMLSALAPGFDEAHSRQLFHGDLKPENVFFGDAGQGETARITDFGVVLLRAAHPNPWPGPLGWVPPEQRQPGVAINAATDVYALGLVLFFALTGRPFFKAQQAGRPDPNALWSELSASPPTASRRASELGVQLKASLDTFFSRALAVNPGDRFRSVGEMASAFAAACSARSGPSIPRPKPPPPPGGGGGLGGTLLMDSDNAAEMASVREAIRVAEANAGGPKPPPPPNANKGTLLISDPGQAAEIEATRQRLREEEARRQPPGPPGSPPAEPAQQPQRPAIAQPTLQSGGTSIAPPPKKSKTGLLIGIGAVVVGLPILGLLIVFVVLPALKGGKTTKEPDKDPTEKPEASEKPAVVDSAAKPPESAAPPPSATAPEPPKAVESLVSFSCVPGPCDEVKCDDVKVDDPKKGVSLKEGKHSCEANKKLFKPATKDVVVKDSKPQTVKFGLAPIRSGNVVVPRKCGTFINPCK